jgi:hypothetical protein
MGSYVLQFEWPEGVKADRDEAYELYGKTRDAALFSAVIVHAGASFQNPAPIAYRVVADTGEVVYRYPPERKTWSPGS